MPDAESVITRMLRDYRASLPTDVTSVDLAASLEFALKQHLVEARQAFRTHALPYVLMRLRATAEALETGDYPTVIKSADFALEQLSEQGVRIIDPTKAEASKGPTVMIGLALGGIDDPKAMPGRVVAAVDPSDGR